MDEGETSRGNGRKSDYAIWAEGEGVPVYRGSYVTDLYNCDIADWPRMGVKGAIVSLAEQEEDDGHVLEIPPGAKRRCSTISMRALLSCWKGAAQPRYGRKGFPSRRWSGSGAASSRPPSTLTTSTSTWMGRSALGFIRSPIPRC